MWCLADFLVIQGFIIVRGLVVSTEEDVSITGVKKEGAFDNCWCC
jgi:hypothetical protein